MTLAAASRHGRCCTHYCNCQTVLWTSLKCAGCGPLRPPSPWQSSLVERINSVEKAGRTPRKRHLTKPECSMLRAAVEFCYVEDPIARTRHSLYHFPQTVFEDLPRTGRPCHQVSTDCRLEQKNFGLTDQFGSPREDLQIKAFSIDFDYVGARRVACSSNLVESVTGTSTWRIPLAFAASGVGVKLLRSSRENIVKGKVPDVSLAPTPTQRILLLRVRRSATCALSWSCGSISV